MCMRALDDNAFREHCFENLSSSTFHFIWHYLRGMIDFDNSEELGQFYITYLGSYKLTIPHLLRLTEILDLTNIL